VNAATPGQAGPLYFTYDGCMALQCFADDPEAEFGDTVAFVDPGDSLDSLAGKVREHQAAHGCAAQEPHAADHATATPGQALSPDPADFAYHVRATAFNVLTGKMAGDEWSVPRSERDAIARAVVDAVEPLIRADERAVAAQEPHAAPGGRSFEDMLADPSEQFDLRSELLASISEYAAAPPASAGIKPWHPHGVPQPAPELAAYEADIASLTGQRNRVSETADQLRAQVRNLRDALERCRDAAGQSPAAVHTIASQALASSPGGDL
jgi:hypothetical protein